MDQLIRDLNNVNSIESHDIMWLNYLTQEFKKPHVKLDDIGCYEDVIEDNYLLSYTFGLDVKLAKKKYYNACKFLCLHIKTNFKGTDEWDKKELEKLVQVFIKRWGIKSLKMALKSYKI